MTCRALGFWGIAVAALLIVAAPSRAAATGNGGFNARRIVCTVTAPFRAWNQTRREELQKAKEYWKLNTSEDGVTETAGILIGGGLGNAAGYYLALKVAAATLDKLPPQLAYPAVILASVVPTILGVAMGGGRMFAHLGWDGDGRPYRDFTGFLGRSATHANVVTRTTLKASKMAVKSLWRHRKGLFT